MFRLRDLNTKESVEALASGFYDPSALFRHEIAYVFGQLCSQYSIPSLVEVLKNKSEEGMVRHEAAEALGSIGSEECVTVLKLFVNDDTQVVRESCIVALDMAEWNDEDGEFAKENNMQQTEIESTA